MCLTSHKLKTCGFYGTFYKKCDELNGKYAHGREDLKDYRTVYLAEGKVFDSEREYLNNL